MPKFNYKAKQGPSKIVDGTIEADREDSAIRKIFELGLTPLDVTETSSTIETPARTSTTPTFSFRKKVPLSAIVLFTRQMCDLVEAAVPLLRVLQLVGKQTRHPILKKTILDMETFVQDGGNLSDALSQHPMIFAPLYINMVRAGELSGQLALVLHRLAALVEKDQETQIRIRSSLAYPIFILAVGIISIFVLLTFVIPRLTVIFEDFNQELPLPTLILIRTSDFLAHYGWIIVVIMGLIFVYVQRWSQTPIGKMRLATQKLHTPVLGSFIQEVEIGRFARTMGTLIESGVTIIEALKSVGSLLENEVLRREIEKVVGEVVNGASLTTALKDCPYFPEAAVNMIAVGEETGHLERGLYKLADSLERQADATAKTMVSLIGPMVLVLVVSLIGVAVVAMLLPIFKMNLIVQ